MTVLCLTIPSLSLAIEPDNLHHHKQKLIRYHDSGAYMEDIAHTMHKAMRYLELRVAREDFKHKKPAIILDIDETTLSNYPDMRLLDFGGSFEDIQRYEDKGRDKAIAPTLKLYRYAKEHHIAVFFLTGRFEEEREITLHNLHQEGFTNHDGLILRSGPLKHAPASIYKTAARKQIENQGYHIILNIGDQVSDLRGGYADKTFKLPNPYYQIP